MFFRSTVSKVIVPTSQGTASSNKSTMSSTSKQTKQSSTPAAMNQHNSRPFAPIFSQPPVPEAQRKSLVVAYLCWLFGGIFGLHHLYLHRDRHAFVFWSTLGGYFGVGWLHDALQMPSYVREANMDPQFVAAFNEKLFKSKKPSFSINRFLGAFMISYIWGQVAMMAIPTEEVPGLNLVHLHWIIPLFVALGVWTVGNIGREKGSLFPCLFVACFVYRIVRWRFFDESIWFTATVFCSAMAFDVFSKKWRLEPKKRKSKKVRAVPIVVGVLVYLALLSSFFYFNGKVTDGEGDEVPIHEAVQNFFNSPWWTDLKQTWDETLKYAEHHGWGETWKQIMQQMDVDGEQNAYKVLGLLPTATQSEVTAKWRKMSRENHPDKVKDEKEREAAQNRFMEIQQAYEALSKVKNKRRQKNKKFNEEEL